MNRIKYLDVAKAIGMLAVIYSHFTPTGNIPFITKFLYSFHIPLFLMVSGFLAHKRNISLKKYISKSFYAYMIPCFIAIFMTVPIYLYIKNVSLFDLLSRIFYISRISFPLNRPTWFLWAIFEVVVVYQLFNIYKYNIKTKLLFVLLGFLYTYIFYLTDFFMPFGLNRLGVCLAFYVLGNILCDLFKTKKEIIKKYLPLEFFISLTIWILTGLVFNGEITFHTTIGSFKFGNYILFALSGIFGAITFLYIAYLLKDVKILNIAGQNTMLVLCYQYPIIYIMREKFPLLMNNDIILIFFSIIMYSLFILLNIFVSKYIPILVGKKHTKK